MAILHTPTIHRYAMSGFYITMDGFIGAAAIVARQRTCQRWHDMATGAIRTLMQYPPQTINDTSWYINGNSCNTNK